MEGRRAATSAVRLRVWSGDLSTTTINSNTEPASDAMVIEFPQGARQSGLLVPGGDDHRIFWDYFLSHGAGDSETGGLSRHLLSIRATCG